MRKLLYLFFFTILLFPSCNKSRNIVDLRKENEIGNIISVYNSDKFEDEYYICTNDTIIRNDTIKYVYIKCCCDKFDALSSIIHRGLYCRSNNSASIAIAQQNHDTKKINELKKQSDDAEAEGAKAQLELKNHLDTCAICKKINNTFDKAYK